MTVEQAVQELSLALDVYHWNEIRDNIRRQVTKHEWVEQYVPVIDGAGLIVKVLDSQIEKEEEI